LKTWLYAAGCVVLPALWGLVMYAVFNRFQRKRKHPPPIDYMI
jgi:hypothetical protein